VAAETAVNPVVILFGVEQCFVHGYPPGKRDAVEQPTSSRITENDPLSGEEAIDLLFVYGTLAREGGGGSNPLLGSAVYLGEASWRGELYLVDWYPGAVASDEPGAMVRGELYRLTDPAAILETLDRYEECGPAFGADAEYVRELTVVSLGDGSSRDAWIYRYNRPVIGLRRLVSGDFRREGKE
jgi:gamma-glutamylcyclotransferase (GGCT)/AIG2-like uncharacterized protein YtfP